jgi:putative phosphoribosyl transferase
MLYYDRSEAGRVLARKLDSYAGRTDVIVLGLPRGGVPVAFEVADALGVPLDVFVVRKLGVPGNKELAMGAIASGEIRVLNEEVIKSFGISDEILDSVAAVEERQVQRQERRYRDSRPPVEVEGKSVILVDDGLATGSTMLAAIFALRRRALASLIVAVPVASASTCEELKREVDEIVCAATPEPFVAVSQWYEEFPQTSDKMVRELLDRAAKPPLRSLPISRV